MANQSSKELTPEQVAEIQSVAKLDTVFQPRQFQKKVYRLCVAYEAMRMQLAEVAHRLEEALHDAAYLRAELQGNQNDVRALVHALDTQGWPGGDIAKLTEEEAQARPGVRRALEIESHG